MKITVNELQELWSVLFPNRNAPPESQFAIWLLRYEESIVRDAIARTAIKFEKLGGEMSDDYVSRFASATMGRLKQGITREAVRQVVTR
jgi:hypothetical protein